VKSAKAQLQQRFGASVAEVDHHELWQRSRLTLSCVARDHGELQRLLDEAGRYLGGQEFELAGVGREIVSLDDGLWLAPQIGRAAGRGRGVCSGGGGVGGQRYVGGV